MPESTLDPNPLRGHIVSFPKVLPSKEWMAQRMLWADHLGAVWPMDAPTPRSTADEAALADARAYMKAGFFTPCRVPWDASPQLLADLQVSLRLPDSAAKKWLRSVGTAIGDVVKPDLSEPDDNQFFYFSKFPADVRKVLLRTRVATKDGHGLVVRTAEQANALLCALAVHAEPADPLEMPRTLETSNAAALARVAAPRPKAESQPAVVVELPVLGGLTAGIEARQIIDFRMDEKSERARQSYLDEVSRHVADKMRLEASGSAAQVASLRLERDLRLASQSFIKRLRSAGATGVGLTAVSTLVPLQNVDGLPDFVALAAGAANLGISGVTSVVKFSQSHVHGYLREAHKAGVIQPVNT